MISNRTLVALVIVWAALEIVEAALADRRRVAKLRADTRARLAADPGLVERMQYAVDGEWYQPVKG